MANRLKAADGKNAGATEAPVEKVNMADRANVIRSVCQDITSLEAKRATISKEIAQLKQTRIKGDLGMKIADFDAAMRVYRLADDDRATFFDTMRESFNALGVGEQLDFLKAGEAAAAPPSQNGSEAAEPAVH